ncbi:DUF1510 family protein [Shouchella sp. JSM 1781072]|uniref:DUF1510 family protein n=1 Tax=Bacillaceae TaxID=186817 RepID=UPI000C087452|nr:DUF1510 family protein [Bacillus sp. Marseille-P3800]
MGQRYENRKDKRKNRILNVAITIVVVLILFFGGTLVFNMMNQPETATEESSESVEPDSDTSDESNDEEANPEEDENETADSANEEEGTEEDDATEDDEATEEDESEQAENVGDVLPTEQTNPTPNNFGGQNWNEMEQAAFNATGLTSSTSDTIWIGNGGSTSSAVVTLLDKGTGLYHQVRLQWVEEPEQGWQIESVEQFENNPT